MCGYGIYYKNTMYSNNNPPQNICILRLSALGDVTHVIPAIRAIQHAWPDASITWICGQFEHRLLSGIDGIRFIVFDKKAGLRAYLKVWHELEGEVFDLMLHMHASARANLLGFLVRAQSKLGWDDDNARDLHRFCVDKKIASGKARHQVQGYLEFVRSLGIDVDEPEWDFPVRDDAMEFANSHIPKELPVLLISPCSSHPLRNWSAERYAKVADYAIEKLGMAVVLSGGPGDDEQRMGEAIEKTMVNQALNLIGKDTLPQLVALLKRADVVISPDSGPAHIANAVGTAVIGLYASTNPERSGPYNSRDLCVDRYADTARIYLNKDVTELAWNKKIEREGVMELIEVGDVIEKLKVYFSRDKK